jgi:hypothetical protein
MSPVAFSGRLFAGALLVGILVLYPLYILNGSDVHLTLYAGGLLLWACLLTSASYAFIFPSLTEPGGAFMNRLLAVTMLRLLLSIGLVLGLWFLVPTQVIMLVVLYFFFYASGLTFEIVVLLRNLRKISK